MSNDLVLYEKRDHLAIVTINRPESMNSLNPPTEQRLREVWDDFAADDDSWVAILTGAGDRAFCAGNDLKYAAEHSEADANKPKALPKGGFGGITWRFDMFKPIIAAINGWAVGGGMEMALACDIIIATESARFGLPETKMGLVAGAGGVHRLPRQLPLKIAMGMVLTGNPISAQEAHRLGLINELVAAPDLMPTAERWATDIMRAAPLAVRGAKEAALKGLGFPLEVAIRQQYDNVEASRASVDRFEGPRAFAEKRTPDWKGHTGL